VVSGSNLAILVMVSSEETTPLDKTITGMTWDVGTPENFTEIVSVGTGSVTNFASIWYLAAPTPATDTITWTHTNSVRSAATIVVLSNAQQTNPTIYDTDTDNNVDDIISIDLTSVTDNSLMFMVSDSNLSGETYTFGSGQTELRTLQGGSNVHGTSYELKVTAGAETLTQESTNANFMVGAGVVVAPAAASPTRRRSTPWILR
jgi:hypothetical protein